MLRFDPGVERSGRLADQFAAACPVARIARFGVRSGSLKRSLEELIPLNETV
jgi:hypothetical protein